jgi:hypothetical protein
MGAPFPRRNHLSGWEEFLGRLYRQYPALTQEARRSTLRLNESRPVARIPVFTLIATTHVLNPVRCALLPRQVISVRQWRQMGCMRWTEDAAAPGHPVAIVMGVRKRALGG